MEKVYFEWEDRLDAKHVDEERKEHDKNLMFNLLLFMTAVCTFLWMENPIKWVLLVVMFFVAWIKNV